MNIHDLKHKESGKERITSRKYEQNHVLTVKRNGREYSLRGTKRPYPVDGLCEFCNQPKIQTVQDEFGSGWRLRPLDYHHWDDFDISKGMWLCQKCHKVVDALEMVFKFLYQYPKYIWMKICRGGNKSKWI